MKDKFEKIWDVVRMRSLRARIFLILLLIGTVPSIVMEYSIVKTYEDEAVELRAQTVQNQLTVITNHLVANDFLKDYNAHSPNKKESHEIIEAELDMLANLYEGRVMIIEPNFKIALDTYNISEGRTMISEEVISCFKGINTYRYDAEHGYIEMTTPVVDTTDDGDTAIQGVMLTSISNSTIKSTITVLNRIAIAIEILTVILVIIFAFFISGVLTRPFQKITNAIAEVKAGYSNEPISVKSYTETVKISDAFNQLLIRMKALDDSREEFVANVSHELKTPMTSVKVLADSLLMQPDAPAEMYREFMEDIASEIDRENRIITDLLALVKMDRTNQDMNVTSVNINELTEMILKRLRPIARKKDIEVVLNSSREIIADIDEVKISLVLSNLVENAIKYNKDHGWVHVNLDADHQFFTVSVEDSGIGIPEDALPHIYERFYRVDKSHSREIGGTGLGLAITRNAILMHRGSVTVTSEPDVGSNFTIKIPLTYSGNVIIDK